MTYKYFKVNWTTEALRIHKEKNKILNIKASLK